MTTFQKIRSDDIAVLQATVEQYVEADTGARHVHLATNQEELVFLVSFPTVPMASDGRAHILEHLALCGSQAYPVADPFFAMMRRSTATFMNAMTYADRTVYPFASTDRTDFFNLLDIYLDAAFFPRLDYLSFRQEGWRHTVKDGKLACQGVVFNEMKGVFNHPMRVLSLSMSRLLFEGQTYACDSGGDPLCIPDLTHEMLQQFHATHYHPSQAIFMTAGAIPASDIQARIAERVLSRKRGRIADNMPGLASGWSAPRHADILLPSQQARADEFGVQLAWLMGQTSDPTAAAQADLLVRGLIGDASAPLMAAMQSAGFGRPSPMNGVSTEARQIVFHLGMEGLTEAQVGPAREYLLAALAQAAEAGVPKIKLQAALRDLRFSQREVNGGGTPDALGRLLAAVPVMMYGGDVLTAFGNDALYDALEKQIDDPDYFKGLVRDVLANQSCLISKVVPDAQFFARRDAIEQARLAELSARMSQADLRKVIDEEQALDAWQNRKQDTSVLPRIRPGDVSADVKAVTTLQLPQPGTITASIPSNGIVYADLYFDASSLPESDWPWLVLCAELLPQLGVGKLGYAEANAWRLGLVPRFSVSVEAQVHAGKLAPVLRFHATGLREEPGAMAEVLQAWSSAARFDEIERMRFLVASSIEQKLAGLAEAGSQYAMLAATAPLSQKKHFQNAVAGMASLPFCATLRTMLASADQGAAIAAKLEQLYRRVLAGARTVVCSGLDQDGASLAALLQATGSASVEVAATVPGAPVQLAAPANLALVISSQVNHCVVAWAVPDMVHADAPALAIAAELMTNNILHHSVREKGGAYGGGAAYVEEDGHFRMSSYRDPRLAATYADFSMALERMLVDNFSDEALEEAKICVIKRLDKPLSPYQESLRALSLQQRGITTAQRQAYRHGVLAGSLLQVRAALQRWLRDGAASRAAVTGSEVHDLDGLQPVNLLAMADPAM